MESIHKTSSASATLPHEDEMDTDYWYASISEEPAGAFIGVLPPTMQKYRQTGAGPPFIRLSARCIRYRRIDLRRWNEARLRKSTSDDQENEEEVA